MPVGVSDLPDAPDRLFLTGRIPVGPRVAIVGTRRPTPEAEKFAFELGRELALAGVVVVSGGALGIDSAAHRGALAAGGGTLVVAPSSYGCPYPEQNRELFQAIVHKGGGHLTREEEPTPARRHAFFARNGLLVSLCCTVIMAQAPLRSGARNATLWARRLNKPYWVVPHAPWCHRGGANFAELRLGGMPLSRGKEVLHWLTEQNQHAVPVPMDAISAAGPLAVIRPALQRLRGEEADVELLLSSLANQPYFPDELCRLLGWHAARLNSTVLHATLRGDALCLPNGCVSLSAAAQRQRGRQA